MHAEPFEIDFHAELLPLLLLLLLALDKNGNFKGYGVERRKAHTCSCRCFASVKRHLPSALALAGT